VIGNTNPLKRIGVPYFPVDPKKIKAIVISDLDDKPSKEAKPSEQGRPSADTSSISSKRRSPRAASPMHCPLRTGVRGTLHEHDAEARRRRIQELPLSPAHGHRSGLRNDRGGKVDWVEGIAFRLSTDACSGSSRIRNGSRSSSFCDPLRSSTPRNSSSGWGDGHQRLPGDGSPGAGELEPCDGREDPGRHRGTYDYARNSPCSIFIASSTTKGGAISTIVPWCPMWTTRCMMWTS